MGTQGLRIRLTDARNVACASGTPFALVITSFVLAPLLTGCSSFSSPSSSAQTAAAAPPQYSAAPPPADDAAAAGYPYPKQSLVELFKDATDSSPAQNVPRPPSTYTPAGQPYPANPQAYSGPTAADRSNMPHPPSTYTASGQPYQPNPPYGTAAGAPPPQPPPADTQAAVPGYPQQSLTDLFSPK